MSDELIFATYCLAFQLALTFLLVELADRLSRVPWPQVFRWACCRLGMHQRVRVVFIYAEIRLECVDCPYTERWGIVEPSFILHHREQQRRRHA